MGRWLASIRFDLLHEIAVAIVNELGGLSTHGYRGEAIFGIEGLYKRVTSSLLISINQFNYLYSKTLTLLFLH